MFKRTSLFFIYRLYNLHLRNLTRKRTMHKLIEQFRKDPRNIGYATAVVFILLTITLSLLVNNQHFSFQNLKELHKYNPFMYMAYVFAIFSLWSGYSAYRKYGKLNQTLDSLRKTELMHNEAQLFTEKLAEGDFKANLSASDSFAKSLVLLRDKLIKNRTEQQKREEEDRQRRWTSEGLARFGDILRTDRGSKLEERAYLIISSLVKYLDANQGGLFVKESDDEQNTYFELLSAYAYDRQKHLEKKILWGEGLIGSTAQEKKTTYLTDLPENYVNITSGLGYATPRSLLIVPLKLEDEVFGIVELATFKAFAPYEIAFIEKVGENIAATISNLQISERTEKLLTQSQQQAEELAAQEEELRQNMEEMQATQESLQESQAKTQMIFQNALDAIITIDSHGAIDQFNPSAERLFGYKAEEVIGKNIAMLMTQDHSAKHDDYIVHYHQTGERKILGRAREVEALHKNGTTIPVEIKVEEAKLGDKRMYVGMLRDITQQKAAQSKSQAELKRLREQLAKYE